MYFKNYHLFQINYLTFIDIAIKQAKRINLVSEILFSLESQEYNVLNY